MDRPTGWKPNTEALGAAARVREDDTDTWLTPYWILDFLGHFDLDVAACDEQPDRCAPRYFVKAENGLDQQWLGRVWCNPPFSDVRPWIRKCSEHANGITLITASVESTVWRETVWKKAKAIFLLAGRTRFCAPDGRVTTGRPLRSIALIAWTIEDADILKRAPFGGVILQNWELK